MHSMMKIVEDWKKSEAERQKKLRPYVKPEILRVEKQNLPTCPRVSPRLSGMLATTCRVTPATVSGNVSNFKIKYPVRYTELVAGYTKPAVEVTEGKQ